MNTDELLNIFRNENIEFKLHNHKALYTVEDSVKMRGSIDGAHSKNLFLKNKKNQFFLFSCLESTAVDLKRLKITLNLGNISFANAEYLKQILNVEPGAVTPYGLLNDIDNKTNFFLDSKILEYEKVSFHPLINTMTVTLNTQDFINFIKKNNKLVKIFNFDNYALVDE